MAFAQTPCAPKNPKGRIWKDHKDDDRKPLNVDDWLDHAIPVETRDEVFGSDMITSAANTNVVVDQTRVDQATIRWRTIGVRAGPA